VRAPVVTTLLDGQGQYAGADRELNLRASGCVETVRESDHQLYARLDATEAYRANVPELKSFVREIYHCNGAYFVIVDSVDLERSASVSWLLHSLHPFQLSESEFRVTGVGAELYGRFVHVTSGAIELSQYDHYPDVAPVEIAAFPRQWHLTGQTLSATSHRIATLLYPVKKGDQKVITTHTVEEEKETHLYVIFGTQIDHILIDK
jgi:hypothetical protein